MLWIVGAGAVVKALDKVQGGGVTEFLTEQLTHAPWQGFRFYDLIFPLFLFIVGVSISLSLDKARASAGAGALVGRVLRRGLWLFLLGVLYYGGVAKPWPEVQMGGVLQRIAACYVFASLIYLWVRRARGIMLVVAALLLGYAALLAWVPFPDLKLDEETVKAAALVAGSEDPAAISATVESRVSGVYEEGRNLTNYLDFRYLPGKKAQRYYINEGLLSTLPAIALSLLGILAGRMLKDESILPKRKVAVLVVAGAASVALGLLWSWELPIIKRIWTSSFILVAAGLSAWMLALFYGVIEVWGWRRWCQPFVWIGANALVIYLAARVVRFTDVASWFTGGDVERWVDRFIAPGAGGVVTACVALLLVILLARFLYRRRIFIRV
ncbi:MAG: DUF5009 domain-containing protein [Verrucomicrobiales bacterium]|nr:DUF5009 domain-containing protein [Verrucomicrobiales bacterium]